ncbi:DUF4181 domain-containing protein [Planococcus sp. X10-3]|uniref:DUF4181 domain-containing protein n=1 Tax=Planococcus sp. X10-3 TaxID=3061240 RepID=UPI003BB014E5
MYDNHPNNPLSWLPSDFSWKLILFLVVAAIILFLVNLLLRKLLNVEKRSFLSPGFVNDRHEKVEFRLGIIAAVLVAVVTINSGFRGLYPLYATLAAGLLITLYRAYMEKKYAENPNQYLFTLLDFTIAVVLVLSLGSFLYPDIPLF